MEERKENGMNTLVELLNEYEKYISKGGLADLREFDGTLNYYSNYEDAYVFENVYYRIISNGYGFIKWLVENDKVDLEKLDEKTERKPQYTFTDDDGRLGFKLFEVYESLLMLLSISKNPISDLISYLR